MAREGAAEGTVVLADEQTSGKGRFGRVWHTPKGTSIAASVILRPSLKELPRLNMVASLAVVKSIEKVAGLKARVKWPNDVLIGGKKVCGILVDSSLRGQELEYAIIGIGLNVNLDTRSLPDISTIATSLSNEMGQGISRLKVLLSLFKEMEALYLELKKGKPLHKKWRSYLVTLGKEVMVKRGDTVLEGRAENVDEGGALLLRLPDGSMERVVSGEVTLTLDQR